MKSMEIDDSISSIRKTKKDHLEKAEKILLTGDYDYDKISTCDSPSRLLVQRVADMYDSLQEILSGNVEAGSWSSSSQRKYHEFTYSYFHRLRWSSVKNEGKEYNIDDDGSAIRNVFALEADLHRAMWLSCLILLKILTSDGQKKCQSRLASQMRNRALVLRRTIRHCRFLVGLLDRIVFQPKTKGEDDDYIVNSNIGVGIGNNMWINRVAEWEKDDRAEDYDDEDDSLNIFSFTKEQLELEAQQLWKMATTPIPTVNTHNLESNTNVNTIGKKRLLIGKLLDDRAESSDSLFSITVEFNDRGFLNTTKGSSVDKNRYSDNEGRCWSLTSQSFMISNYNKSPDIIQINNMISFATGKLTALVLQVGQEHLLWQSEIYRVQSDIERRLKLVEAQQEIKKLWPVEEVMNAQNVALEFFDGEIRKGL